ncbi:hypothetical protein ZIOFF_070292 [Zingiber officinale]|uniref:Uncharacterized protein n=1 Tax=Zingiber officinale TaxID=94328 RepID=A0A8J5CCC5_ZINOF|nr:hypothetical protein ZIOFF_070292 [Zingiber officinale]
MGEEPFSCPPINANRDEDASHLDPGCHLHSSLEQPPSSSLDWEKFQPNAHFISFLTRLGEEADFSPPQPPISIGRGYMGFDVHHALLKELVRKAVSETPLDDNSSSDEGEATTSEEKGKAVKEIVIEKAAKENVMKDAMALRILQQSAHERRVNKYSTPVEQAFQTKLNISEKKQEQKDRAENNRESYGRGGRSRGRGRGRAGSQFRRDDQFWNRSGNIKGNKEHFVEIDNSYNSLLELGDSKKLKIEGKGVVAIKAANGEEKQINDVVYSPGITQNLLSIGQMMKKGYKITFADGQCEIVDKNEKRIAVVKMTTNNLFPLKMNSCINVALKSEITDEAQLWHLRYGHLNHKGLMLLKEKNMVTGLPRIQPTEIGFCEGCVSVEPSLYVKKCDADFLVACLYVDDLIYTSTSKALLEEFKKAMMDEFEMTDLGLMKYFLGFQVRQSKGENFISQEKYVDDILKKFHMEKAKAVATPMALNEKLQQYDGAEKFDSKIYRSLIGSLIYLTHTRMDIVQSVSLLSRFMSNPTKTHFAAAKRVLRYLQEPVDRAEIAAASMAGAGE